MIVMRLRCLEKMVVGSIMSLLFVVITCSDKNTSLRSESALGPQSSSIAGGESTSGEAPEAGNNAPVDRPAGEPAREQVREPADKGSVNDRASIVSSSSLSPIPQRPTALALEKFQPASHVGPDELENWPKPVVVVLHGNFDRPEWECDTWKKTAGFYGWILCPRGKRTPYASREEDRWTYAGAGIVSREIEAGLVALEEKYPNLVTRDNMVLAGFSLGGIISPKLVEVNPSKFSYLFLVEGGVKKLDSKRVGSMKKNGVLGIAMAMSAPGRRNAAKKLLPKIEKRGLSAVFVDMRGAGHGYRRDFSITGKTGLRKLVTSDTNETTLQDVRSTDGGK